MTDTILFDLDGTLLNTLEDIADGVNYALRKLNFPERTLDEIKYFIGNGVVKLIDRAVPSGTIIVLPLLMILSFPFVFAPRPLFCPLGTA